MDVSLRDSLFTVVSGSVIVHLIFKRLEPTNLLVLTFLLLLVPSALSTFVIPNVSNIVIGVLATYIVFYTSLITSILIYRTSFLHPLSRYPGPWQARISNAWLVYKDWHGQQFVYVDQLHKKYGNIVRIGPNELSIRDPHILPQMMGAGGLVKGPNMAGIALNPPIRPLLAISDPAEHSRRRRPWTRAFSTTALKEYHPIIQKRVMQLTELLANTCTSGGKGGKEVAEADADTWTDLTQWIAFFTYDLMGDMVFGGGTELLRDGDPEGNVEKLKNMLAAAMLLEHIPWLGDFAKRLPVAEEVTRVRAADCARTNARLERGTHSKDLFYYLSNEDGVDATTPSIDVLLSDATLAIGAGADTTASVLSNVFFFILLHRKYYEVLREEVDHFYAREEDAMDTKHHSNMLWMEAIINEALRLYPVVPGGSQRTVVPGQGDRTLGPYYIPEGTQARMHFYAMHRDPANFTSPDLFLPERWIIADSGNYPSYTTKLSPASSTLSPEKLTHNVNAFVPFSYGPANCVGKNLALQEMRTVVCNLMHKLDMRLADWYDTTEWHRSIEDYLAISVGRLPVVVTVRE